MCSHLCMRIFLLFLTLVAMVLVIVCHVVNWANMKRLVYWQPTPEELYGYTTNSSYTLWKQNMFAHSYKILQDGPNQMEEDEVTNNYKAWREGDDALITAARALLIVAIIVLAVCLVLLVLLTAVQASWNKGGSFLVNGERPMAVATICLIALAFIFQLIGLVCGFQFFKSEESKDNDYFYELRGALPNLTDDLRKQEPTNLMTSQVGVFLMIPSLILTLIVFIALFVRPLVGLTLCGGGSDDLRSRAMSSSSIGSQSSDYSSRSAGSSQSGSSRGGESWSQGSGSSRSFVSETNSVASDAKKTDEDEDDDAYDAPTGYPSERTSSNGRRRPSRARSMRSNSTRSFEGSEEAQSQGSASSGNPSLYGGSAAGGSYYGFSQGAQSNQASGYYP